MSEPDHLPRANQLRFSLVIGSVVVVGLALIGVQKLLQWRADDEFKVQQDEQERVAFQRKLSIADQEPEPTSRTIIPPSKWKKPTGPVVVAPPAKTVPPVEADSAINSEPPAPPTPNVPNPALVAGVPRGTRTSGSIFGTVFLQGTPPPEKEIAPLSADPTCGRLHSEPIKTRFYVTGANKGVANTFVYLQMGLPRGRKYKPTTEALLDQVGCLYEPYVSGVMVDQKLKIRNSDPALHNVHATPARNSEFNFAQPVQGQVTERSFALPELMVRFKCDVHPWMFAYVSVVEHPFFAVTDDDGNFEIKGVPPGRYQFEAVHLKAGRQTRSAIIGHDGNAEHLVFTLQVPQ